MNKNTRFLQLVSKKISLIQQGVPQRLKPHPWPILAARLKAVPSPAPFLKAVVVLLSGCYIFLLAPFAFSAANPDGSIGGLHAKFVDVKGVRTRYYELGEGEPMVLIHGGFTAGSSTANVWSRNIPGLAKRFHVFAFDRLGSGMTGNPLDDKDYNREGDTEHAYQFIQTLNLGPVHLVGHSNGGAVAMQLALAHPEVVKTLTIVAIGPENPKASEGLTKLDNLLKKCPDQSQYEGLRCRVEVLGWLPASFDPEYWEADAYMANLPKSKEARVKLNAGAGEPLRTKEYPATRQKQWERIRNGALQMPVLMFAGKQDVLDWGENDPAAKLTGELALFDIMGAKNPKVKMIILNNSGHFMYREHPEVFNRDLMSFVEESESADKK